MKQWIKLFIVFICWRCFQCPSGGHSFTVEVYKYTAWLGMIFYFTLLICIVFFFFFTKLSFVSVCLFVFFSFFLPPPILGIRSLAGGRREYGRSGREQLFNPFFICCYSEFAHTFCPNHELKMLPSPLSVCTTFQCFHLFSHWIRLNQVFGDSLHVGLVC